MSQVTENTAVSLNERALQITCSLPLARIKEALPGFLEMSSSVVLDYAASSNEHAFSPIADRPVLSFTFEVSTDRIS